MCSLRLGRYFLLAYSSVAIMASSDKRFSRLFGKFSDMQKQKNEFLMRYLKVAEN